MGFLDKLKTVLVGPVPLAVDRFTNMSPDDRQRAISMASKELADKIPGDTFIEGNWIRTGEMIGGGRSLPSLVEENLRSTADFAVETVAGAARGVTEGAVKGAFGGLGLVGTVAVVAAGGLVLAVVLGK